MSELPDLLRLTDLGGHNYEVVQPGESAEGRDVVYSGQLLSQMIMASDRACAGAKEVRSIHAVFARVGTYTKPIELRVDSMQAGRTWASDTVSATQDGRLLCRGTVLLNTIDPDLIRHEPDVPEGVPGPDESEPATRLCFPDAERRLVPGETTLGGAPVLMAWHRYPVAQSSPAANQAILVWATCGEVIGLSLRPHRDRVRAQDTHHTVSTGVIGHTVHFIDRFDVSDWLLIVTESTKAGAGRVHGGGRIYTRSGALVATFHQDSMAKQAGAEMDPRRAL